MSHTIRDQKKLKARTNKIQGQVIALKKMLDEPHECAAVLQQIAAIRGAVNGLMREVRAIWSSTLFMKGMRRSEKPIWTLSSRSSTPISSKQPVVNHQTGYMP